MALLSEMPDAKLVHSVLVYGGPKSGKTEAVGRLAELGYHLHWLDIEGGALTLKKLPMEAKSRIHLYQLKDSSEIPVASRTLTTIFDAKTLTKDHTFCAEHGLVGCKFCIERKLPFETINFSTLTDKDIVVVDSGTQLSDSIMADLLLTMKVGSSKLPLGSPEAKPEYEHYRAQGARLDKILDFAKIIPCHFILITHEEAIEHEDKLTKITPVLGTRSYAARVARNFSHVVYLSLENKLHKAVSSTTSNSKTVAGSRTDADVEKAPIKEISLSAIFPKII